VRITIACGIPLTGARIRRKGTKNRSSSSRKVSKNHKNKNCFLSFVAFWTSQHHFGSKVCPKKGPNIFILRLVADILSQRVPRVSQKWHKDPNTQLWFNFSVILRPNMGKQIEMRSQRCLNTPTAERPPCLQTL